jgi:hypothetical protein
MARRPGAQAALVFFVAIVVYNSNLRYIASYDSYATSLLPFRLLSGHGLTVDPSDAVSPVAYSVVRSRTGQLVSFFPVVAPLLVTPLYVPVAWLVPRVIDPGVARVLMEKLAASVLAAASVALLFLALRRLTTERIAWLLALAFGFGTLTWAVSSQALWLQTSSEFLLALCLWRFVRGVDTVAAAAVLGLVAGLLAANRPTDAVFAGAFAVLVWRTNRRAFASFSVTAGAAGAATLAWNVVHFGHVLGGYGVVFLSSDRMVHGAGLAGGAGLLLSNRGLLLFSPFLFGLLAYRHGRARMRGTTLLLVCYAVSIWVHGRAWDWWGSYCYGARYTLHGLPVLFVALAEPAERLWTGMRTRILFLAGMLLAFVVQVAGAFFYPGGDSGNAGFGLWSYAKAPPFLALASGPAIPDFLGFVVRRLGMPPAPLSPREAAARCAWREEPPAVWRPNERRRLGVAVENLGPVSWKSLGGFMNGGGVRLAVAWRREGEVGPPVLEAVHWLALRLRSGATARLDVDVQAPPEEGRFTLVVGLTQLGIGPFPSGAAPQLASLVSVALVDDGVRWELSVPVELDPNRGARAHVRVRGGGNALSLAWRWRRPGGEVIRVDGPVALTPGADAWREADVSLPTRLVASAYVLEFGLVDPGRLETFESVSPARRVTLSGDWAATISGRRPPPA